MTPRFVSLLLLATIFCSCHRIKHKLSQAKDAGIHQLSQAKDAAADKIFPSNESLFATRFKGISVTNFNAYTDFMGVDYKELYSFNCTPDVIAKIVKDKKMERVPASEEGLDFGEESDWWNKEKLSKMSPYFHGSHEEDYQYLWYDSTTQQAWYIIYSL